MNSSEWTQDEKLAQCPQRLQEIIDDFREADRQDRMEYLIDYALELPELPEHLMAMRDQMEQVHECQTPVFLHTERRNGSLDFHFDIPRESPTVRGYAGVLVDGFDGATPEEVFATPDDVYVLLKLQDVVTLQRLRGLHFLLHYMKRQVKKLINE